MDKGKNKVPSSFPGSIGLLMEPNQQGVILSEEYRRYGEVVNDDFDYFISRILPAVNPSKSKFNERKGRTLIGEMFSVTDEAFGLMIIYNEHHVWEEQEEAKRRGIELSRSNRKRKRFCDGKSGNKQGWMEAGRNIFNKLCKELKTRRDQTKDLEENIMSRFADNFGISGDDEQSRNAIHELGSGMLVEEEFADEGYDEILNETKMRMI